MLFYEIFLANIAFYLDIEKQLYTRCLKSIKGEKFCNYKKIICNYRIKNYN